MDVGECNRRRLYIALRLDYRFRLWVPTSASRAISAVAELLVLVSGHVQYTKLATRQFLSAQ